MQKDYKVVFVKKGEAALAEDSFDENACAPGEVLGKNIISLISTGSERGGLLSDFTPESYPSATGSSGVARVMRVGEGVEGFKEGDLFFHSEHHSLFVRAKAADILRLPNDTAPEKAIFGRYAAVSMTSIYNAKMKPVETVLVTGLGLVGLMCAQTLNAFGYRVYAVDPSGERRDIAQKTGLLYIAKQFTDFTGIDHTASALMECSGNENAILNALPFLRKGGEIFQIGVPWHKCADWDAHSLLYSLFYGFLSLHGGWEWSLPRKPGDFYTHSNYGHVASAMEMIAAGRIQIPEDIYDLRDARECAAVYHEITIPKMRPTAMMLDWRDM